MGSMGEKRTPMAWQHRDMNYHQGGAYQERYTPSIDYPGGKPGPPSSSDRVSHRTDKSWRTKDSQPSYRGARSTSGEQYPPSRPSYSTGRPTSQLQSADSSSETASSTEEDTVTDDPQLGRGPPLTLQPQNLYGYAGYGGYPGGGPQQAPYAPSQGGYAPTIASGYQGTMKSAKSVPALAMNTWNGEPCPLHGNSQPFSLPGPHGHPGPHGPPMMGPPSHMGPMGPASLPPVQRRAASIYDMRMGGAMYGTLPHRPPGVPVDRRSAAGGPIDPMQGIPPQFLPPMARPRPIVVSEDGTAEPLPVRSPPDKNGSISGLMAAKMANERAAKQKRRCTKGASCVAWTILSVISLGIILGLLLAFIL